MKARNLEVLRSRGINVPKFIVVEGPEGIDLSFSGAELFAVRSSCALEDSEEKSYAGQFKTLLNVRREEVGEAVRTVLESASKIDVYESFKGTASKALKLHPGQPKLEGTERPPMRVIVQEMVASDISGVLFTANPQGLLNETVIVAGRGLGEDVVTDRTETTTYYYNQDDQLYCFEGQEEGVLTAEQLYRLVKIGEKIRHLFQREMDVEYAIKGDDIFILQARPITTLQYKDLMVLDNSNIVESYPGVCLPLTQSFVRTVYYEIFRNLVLRLSGNRELVRQMEPILKNMVDVSSGKIYYCISSWYDVLQLLPFSSRIIPIWQEMLGVGNRKVTAHVNRVSPAVKGRILLSFLKYMHTTPREMKALNERFRQLYPAYVRRVRAQNSLQGLLDLYDGMRREILKDWDITLANDMYAFLYTHLAGKGHADALAQIRNLESMKPVLALEELVKTAKASGLESEAYQRQKRRFISRYGDRCLQELKLETKTWRTNPELVDEFAAQGMKLLEKGEKEYTAPKVAPGRGFHRRGSRTTHRAEAGPFVLRARLGIANRELSRMNRSRLFGVMRMIVLKIGAILADQGRLEQAEDVFYLFLDELKDERRDYRQLAAERKKEYADYEKLPAYSRLVFADRVFDRKLHGVSSHTLGSSGELLGIVSSAGKICGQVLVITSPDQGLDTAGKIIVTKSTDPGWVFLIRPALGVIAEKGSILSHTAIITRELGKPSLVGVKDAVKLLKTGDTVELDALEGRVRVIK